MKIELNHTIVPAHDKEQSARFYERIFGFKYEGPLGHFAPVRIESQSLSLDFDNSESFQPHHYAFKVGDTEFDEIFGRVKAEGLAYGGSWEHRVILSAGRTFMRTIYKATGCRAFIRTPAPAAGRAEFQRLQSMTSVSRIDKDAASALIKLRPRPGSDYLSFDCGVFALWHASLVLSIRKYRRLKHINACRLAYCVLARQLPCKISSC